MARLAIKGHATRGKEVIRILEMLGGDNSCFLATGNIKDLIYYISETKCRIEYSRTFEIGLPQISIFTLEEFLEKFPYKVGNKVLINDIEEDIYTISSMVWDEDLQRVAYKIEAADGILDDHYWFADEMKPYKKQKSIPPYMDYDIKEKTMEEIKIDIPKGYEFAGVDDNAQQVVFTKIQPEYPKTYEECCNVLYE